MITVCSSDSHDNNAQDGDGSEMDTDIPGNMFLDMSGGFGNTKNDLNEWNVVCSKHTIRQRISSSGQSGQGAEFIVEDDIVDAGDYDTLSNGGKLSLCFSQLSINEHRVKN